ncbi:CHRD domain-containing protein [Botrimarina sp.]|uniref:CHRD domain-containing protein n=1 Tax=Botrimarina sp. TaxID=2795802 RepID=UPI0032EBC92C
MRYSLPLVALFVTPLFAGAAHLTQFDFPLSVEQTNPPATFPDGATLPSGMASVLVDSDAMTISWDVDYQDLTGPIVAPGAHFHGPAEIGSNAGVQIFLSDGDPAEPASGNLSGMSPLTSDQLSDVLSGLWYLNIHTAANGSGELRGQVVPEPAALAMATVISAPALLRRRKC